MSAIAGAVNNLKALRTVTLDEFLADPIISAAVERHFQVAIQAMIDVGSMIVAAKSTTIPATYRDIFYELAKLGIIDQTFANKLADMAGFRNILVHLYLEVDQQRVYDFLQNQLVLFDQFMQQISTILNENSP